MKKPRRRAVYAGPKDSGLSVSATMVFGFAEPVWTDCLARTAAAIAAKTGNPDQAIVLARLLQDAGLLNDPDA